MPGLAFLPGKTPVLTEKSNGACFSVAIVILTFKVSIIMPDDTTEGNSLNEYYSENSNGETKNRQVLL